MTGVGDLAQATEDTHQDHVTPRATQHRTLSTGVSSIGASCKTAVSLAAAALTSPQRELCVKSIAGVRLKRECKRFIDRKAPIALTFRFRLPPLRYWRSVVHFRPPIAAHYVQTRKTAHL